MKSSSTQRFSIRCFRTPLMKPMSPPVWIAKNSSAKRVPKRALPGTEGTQYRSSPGSRIGFTTDPGALLLRIVQIFHRHGLVVRHVGAEEDDQIAADPIRV